MIKFFTKFLASQFSGWLFVALALGVMGISGTAWHYVSDYKDLKTDAAYCKGQLDTQKVLLSLQNRAAEQIEDTADNTIEVIEALRDTPIDETNPELGCAGQRVPDAILRYHGWLRD